MNRKPKDGVHFKDGSKLINENSFVDFLRIADHSIDTIATLYYFVLCVYSILILHVSYYNLCLASNITC